MGSYYPTISIILSGPIVGHNTLQKAVDINKHWFQLKLGLGGVAADNIQDFYRIPTGSIVLHITYEVTG